MPVLKMAYSGVIMGCGDSVRGPCQGTIGSTLDCWDTPLGLELDPKMQDPSIPSNYPHDPTEETRPPDWKLPEKPVAYNNGLLSMNHGLVQGIVAHSFGLLGLPGSP